MTGLAIGEAIKTVQEQDVSQDKYGEEDPLLDDVSEVAGVQDEEHDRKFKYLDE